MAKYSYGIYILHQRFHEAAPIVRAEGFSRLRSSPGKTFFCFHEAAPIVRAEGLVFCQAFTVDSFHEGGADNVSVTDFAFCQAFTVDSFHEAAPIVRAEATHLSSLDPATPFP